MQRCLYNVKDPTTNALAPLALFNALRMEMCADVAGFGRRGSARLEGVGWLTGTHFFHSTRLISSRACACTNVFVYASSHLGFTLARACMHVHVFTLY